MEEHNKELTSLKANVRMSKMNLQLNLEDTYEGKVAYRPNGKDIAVRIDWTKPRAETLAVLNGEYVAYTPSLNQAILGKANLDNPKNRNLAFLNMSKAQLKENYVVAYDGTQKVGEIECWHLRLTPKIRADYKQIELWVDIEGMPRQSKVTENTDDTTTVLLTDLQKNVEIPVSVFAVTLPKGVKKIKG
jgi:outer membrane lipoprotein-sorting protein